ncbi:MAG: metallophosphoesterase [Bacteriovoracia bacterium]
MKILGMFLPFFFFLQSCGKPEATVFEDKRLAQEELVKICLTGDMGKDTQIQEEMAKALGRENCHRIFMLGDLVYPKGIKSIEDPELQNKFLSYYQPLLEKDPDLIIGLILGNHDHKGKPESWLKIDRKHERFFFPNYYYMIDYGGLCLVAIDTSFYYYESKVKELTQQTKWMTQLQSRLKECDVKVALTHHPLKGDMFPDWEGASGALKLFLETFIIGKFDVHAAGHVHVLADDGKDEGTKLLISGTGGEVSGDGKPGYIVLTWEPKNPKRLGYFLREIDIDVNVYQAQQEPPEQGYAPPIERSYVETNWFRTLWLKIKDLF